MSAVIFGYSTSMTSYHTGYSARKPNSAARFFLWTLYLHRNTICFMWTFRV